MEDYSLSSDEFERARDIYLQQQLDSKGLQTNDGRAIQKTFSRKIFELIIDCSELRNADDGSYDEKEVKELFIKFTEGNKFCGHPSSIYHFFERFLNAGNAKNFSDIDQTKFKIPDGLPYKGKVFVFEKNSKLFLPMEDVYATGIAQEPFIFARNSKEFGEKLAIHMSEYFEVRKDIVKLIAKSTAESNRASTPSVRGRSNPGLASSSILPVNRRVAAPFSSVLPSGTFESGDAINVRPGGVVALAGLLAGAPPGMNFSLNYNCGTHTHTHTRGGNHNHGGTHHHNDGGDELRQEVRQSFQKLSQNVNQGFEEVNENLAFTGDVIQQVNENVESTIRRPSEPPTGRFNRSTNGYSPRNMDDIFGAVFSPSCSATTANAVESPSEKLDRAWEAGNFYSFDQLRRLQDDAVQNLKLDLEDVPDFTVPEERQIVPADLERQFTTIFDLIGSMQATVYRTTPNCNLYLLETDDDIGFQPHSHAWMLYSSFFSGVGFPCSFDLMGTLGDDSKQFTLQVASTSSKEAASTVGVVLQVMLCSCSSVSLEGYEPERKVLLPLSESRIRKIAAVGKILGLRKFIVTQGQHEALESGELEVKYRQCRLALDSGVVSTDQSGNVVTQQETETPGDRAAEESETVPDPGSGNGAMKAETEPKEGGSDATGDSPLGWDGCFKGVYPTETWKCETCLAVNPIATSLCGCKVWLCPNSECRKANEASRESCEDCGHDKPAEPHEGMENHTTETGDENTAERGGVGLGGLVASIGPSGFSFVAAPAHNEPPAAASSEKESSEEGSRKWTHQGELEGAKVFVNSEGLRKFVFAEGEGTVITEVAPNDDASETFLEYEHAGSRFQAVPPRKEAPWCKKCKEFCEKGKGEACHWHLLHGGGHYS